MNERAGQQGEAGVGVGVGVGVGPARWRPAEVLASSFYRLAYRFGRPRWDTGQPRSELQELVAGGRPGRALDLGCGTGTNAVYLAKHGWEVVGVDFVPRAIEAARGRALEAGETPRFVVGDVTHLRRLGVDGPFDLIVDVGCYHSVPDALRCAYATEVAAVARHGADFYLAGISDAPVTWRLLGTRGTNAADLRHHLGADFDLDEGTAIGVMGRASSFVLYHLVRKAAAGRPVT